MNLFLSFIKCHAPERFCYSHLRVFLSPKEWQVNILAPSVSFCFPTNQGAIPDLALGFKSSIHITFTFTSTRQGSLSSMARPHLVSLTVLLCQFLPIVVNALPQDSLHLDMVHLVHTPPPTPLQTRNTSGKPDYQISWQSYRETDTIGKMPH